MAPVITCPACNTPLRVREEQAGKKLKCPKCAAIIPVPARESAAAPSPVVDVRPAARPVPPTVAEAPSAVEEGPPKRKAARQVEMLACPRCGEMTPADAEKCKHCKAGLYDDEQDERRPKKKSKAFKPCPKCGAGGAKRVTWTPWGSFYGPAMFNHVRCPQCDYKYNGRTGGSNLIPAIIFITIPLLLIGTIIGGLIYYLIASGKLV